MQTKIKENIDNPQMLEQLYREDKKGFEKAFWEIYPGIGSSPLVEFWKARLDYVPGKDDTYKISKKDILFLLVSCAVASILIKLPQLFNIPMEQFSFYEKNVALIVFVGLSIYALLVKKAIKPKPLLFSILVFIVSVLFINLLPPNNESQTVNLAYLHLPFMLWCLYGLIYIDFDLKNKAARFDFIKHNGDVAIMMAMIAIAGGILTGMTVALFEAIDIKIGEFYFQYVVLCGAVSLPVVATFVIQKFPMVTHKIAPVIANIFSPLVLITLVIYLISIAITGKDPYNDRDFLVIFNAMLLSVMAIVVFAISGLSGDRRIRISEWTLFALAIVTLIIDLVVLSAIVYRLGEYGFTPNRTAVLGSNLLILGNLLLITKDLYITNFKQGNIKQIEHTLANYLPLYALWTALVVFGFPLIFGVS
jgi:hypothetical protein